MKIQYTLVVFKDSEKDLVYIKEAFKDGRAVVMSNFPEVSFGNLDNFLTEQLELDLALNG